MAGRDVFQEALTLVSQGEKAALSTIVSSKGSLPMSKKAKMLVRPDGKIIGTVGGGCLEADVWAEARHVMETEAPTLQKFILTENTRAKMASTAAAMSRFLLSLCCPVAQMICSAILLGFATCAVRLCWQRWFRAAIRWARNYWFIPMAEQWVAWAMTLPKAVCREEVAAFEAIPESLLRS